MFFMNWRERKEFYDNWKKEFDRKLEKIESEIDSIDPEIIFEENIILNDTSEPIKIKLEALNRTQNQFHCALAVANARISMIENYLSEEVTA
ncbi:MAG: hypothetical protein EAX96_06165 [Candidatus Lokiarchaeota archaeon]|nr:hypothetical protein [Candidatus Lokiarchaeota archaeon]